jgi:hypothetical protein
MAKTLDPGDLRLAVCIIVRASPTGVCPEQRGGSRGGMV